jgi:uncharacterized membrane protein YfcA
MIRAISCPYFQRAFGFAVPIGGLAGLVGLGGGEFRLPVLIHVIGFPAKAAVPLNLVVSLATLAFALVTRNHAVPALSVLGYLPEIVGLTFGGMVSAAYGTRLVAHLTDSRLVMLISALLAALGVLLLVEAFVPFGQSPVATASDIVRGGVGVGIGLGVGAVSSVLGVAGGELLIPALVFIFGADIKTAGTASLMISLVVVATGVWRYGRAGELPMTGGPQRIATAMTIGSLLGAAVGGLAVGLAPASFLKAFLGLVLIAAAVKAVAGKEKAR